MITNLIGTRIRALRSRGKMTQQTLAELAGIPRATLATVEKDGANPSLAVAWRIARALGVAIDDLVEEERHKIQKLPAAGMLTTESGDGNYRAVTVSPAGAFHFLQQAFEIRPGAIYQGRPHPPGSEEYLYIISGVVLLEVEGETSRLERGDSACFHGNVRHSYLNPLEEPARGMVTILEGRLGGVPGGGGQEVS
ncbi:MAG: helix-turn-helix transcriptional regulator [Magnetococcales bacterium]|nr:helix-turn-helix transcriptional regulator [Magnetococcales bacterium]MBF0156969.1 helix-turn-helix transcriptional regulator [Magnetococcales bacterium]